MDLCFVDLETTGLDPFVDEVVEVAVARTTHARLMGNDIDRIKIRSVRVMPLHPARAFLKPNSPGAVSTAQINGFDIEQWRISGACTWIEAVDKISQYLTGCKWVGANAAFDYMFYRSLCSRHNVTPVRLGDYHLCDISSIAHPIYMAGRLPNLKMDSLAEHYGFSFRGSKIHTAVEDVRMAMHVYHGLHTELTVQG